jgi:uncharacterized phage protein gp47/JayE
MADFDIPSVEDLRDRGLRSINAEIPEQRTGQGTPANLEMSAFARVVSDNHVHVQAVDADVTPSTASEAGLYRWADPAMLNIPRKSATPAFKAQALEVRGTAAAVVPINTELLHRTGLTFKTSAAVVIPASGIAKTDIIGISTGASTRLPAGEALRFTTPPASILETARLVLDLDEGGDDDEPVGVWRARVVERWREPGQGGNLRDYTQWILAATAAVRSAYVYSSKPGLAFVSLAGLRAGEGTSRILSASENAEILAYVEDLAPIGDELVVLTVETGRVDVDMQISTLGAQAFDWDDSAGYTVTTWTEATRVLDMGTVPTDLAAGDLLVIKSADPDTSLSDGYPAVVSAVLSASEVVLSPYPGRSQPFTWTPAPADVIYAYSETALAVREAIVNGYSLGCGATAVDVPGINGLGPANPDRLYGDWESDVTRARLSAAAQSVAGVVLPTINVPAADVESVESPFPDTHIVELLIPGEILVRPA